MGRGTMVRLLLVVPLLAGALALGAPSPAAAATVCGDTPSGEETLNNTIKDSIVVPANSKCTLVGATVRGGVTVEAGGELFASSSEVRGSVSGVGAYRIQIFFAVVRGSVTVAGATETAHIYESEVRGDVSFSGVPFAFLTGANVRGSATLTNNGYTEVYANTIQANLTCAGNDTLAIPDEYPNTVGGTNDCAPT